MGGGDYSEIKIKSQTPQNSFNPTTQTIDCNFISKHFRKISHNHFQTDLEDITPYIIQKMPDDLYIHFIDSDDFFSPHCIELCIKLASQKEYDIIWHDFNMFFQSLNITTASSHKQKFGEWESGVSFLKQASGAPFSWVWKGVFRAKLLNCYNLRFQYRMDYEDCDFGIILFLFAQKIIYTNFIGLTYLIRQHSLSNFKKRDPFPKTDLPKHLEELKPYFHSYFNLKKYFGCYCYFRIANILNTLQCTQKISKDQSQILEKHKNIFIALGSRSLLCLILTNKIKNFDSKNIKSMAKQLISARNIAPIIFNQFRLLANSLRHRFLLYQNLILLRIKNFFNQK